MLFTRRQLLHAGGFWSASGVLSAAHAAASLRSIDIVMTAGVSGLIVHEVARSQGFLTEFGVDPRILEVSDGGKCVAALVSGAAQICIWSGFNQVTPAIERGARLKIIAGALTLPSLAMYSSRPDIRRVADLAGKTIGIGGIGAVVHQMTVLLLKKKGVDVAAVQFRNVGSNADILRAVVARAVDAGLSDVDVFGQQQQLGFHALTDGLLWKETPEYTNQASYASDVAIRQDRPTLVRTLAAYAKAYRFICAPESRAAFIRARQVVTGVADPTQGITEWNWIRQYQPYDLNLVLSRERIDFVQNLNVQFGVQQHRLPMEGIADMSLAADAVRLLS